MQCNIMDSQSTLSTAASKGQQPSATQASFDFKVVTYKLALCLSYIAVSSALIRFNKHMMHKDVFPFALALSAIHMLVSMVMCGIMYIIFPSMFPSMHIVKEQRTELVWWFLPIGVCFAVMLFGSNQAYLYCSVAILQFMKEANVMIVFLISCAVGLQVVNRVRVTLIIWVLVGSTVSVSGDLHFSLVGIAFQAVSQVSECTRMVLGEIVLSGRKLDPLTYTAFVAPTCLIVLLIANIASWDSAILPAAKEHWRLLLANACIAFMLNVLVATVIKEFSAVGFVLTGLTKDIVIVSLSCMLFGEHVTAMQSSAFAITLAGVGMWSLMKIAPDSPPVRCLERLLCIPGHTTSETQALLNDKKV